MYGELASVKGIVDLSPQDALDRAEAFLAAQGYIIAQRTYTTVTAQRRAGTRGGERDLPTLTVALAPQPDGGVRMTVRGNDQEGVQQRQAAWLEWSEALPKKAEPETAEAAGQGAGGASDVPVPPQPQAEGTGGGAATEAHSDVVDDGESVDGGGTRYITEANSAGKSLKRLV